MNHNQRIWSSLVGTWSFKRKLSSTNLRDPNGTCTGTATFISRSPSVFVDKDGNLQLARKEMVYHERGNFAIDSSINMGNGTAGTMARVPFERKYVWRLEEDKSGSLEEMKIGIWFVKPGTDAVDYLFHYLLPQGDDVRKDGCLNVEYSGGHLCAEDFYSSTYNFEFLQKQSPEGGLVRWHMTHEVRGPSKDQVIETWFDR